MSTSLGRHVGPHQRIEVNSPRDRFTTQLFDRLWMQYRERVSYVQMYEQVLRSHAGTFVNDHIAFRTFATQTPGTGIHSLGRIFEALDYLPAGCYTFPDKQLSAIHYRHANPAFPKLFVSELQTWKLPAAARQWIGEALASHRQPLSDALLAEVWQRTGGESPHEIHLLDSLVDWFSVLPWSTPRRDALFALNHVNQYAAWVLVHGYNVNHFTSLINSHGVESLNDIEKTITALRQAGVPMKQEIEGASGSALRQTATEAVTVEVNVLDENDQSCNMPWTYAYFELAQRDWKIDPVTGQRYRFEGFLGSQATNLFEMTRLNR